jgi:protein required for attachment to host cells
MLWWILIADAAGAKIFSTKGATQPLHLERSLDNPSGRAAGRDILTDEPGRYRKGGNALSAFEPQTSPHVVEEEKFVHKLAEVLGTALSQRKFDSLAIVAPAKFLGLLRRALSPQVQKHLTTSIAKDLTAFNERDLPQPSRRCFCPRGGHKRLTLVFIIRG